MAASAAPVPAAPQLDPESNLSRYLQEIRKFPLLEPDEEFMLAKRWREHEDAEAAHRLVTSHLRLVAKIASGYRGYGLPMGELISEGNVGMMQAVKRFDPDRGFRLATYAMWWDPRLDPGIHPALLVAGEDRHHGRPKEAVLQPQAHQGRDQGDRGGRPPPRERRRDRHPAQRLGGRGGADEPPHGRARQLAQRAGPRRRRGRVDGLAGRRERVAGDTPRRGRGVRPAPGAA